MFLLIDTADCHEIERAVRTFPLAGVTTNPTIIVREKRDFFAILNDIRKLIGNDRMLHAQVMGSTAEEIVADARCMRERIPGNFYVKLPVTTAGFQAMGELKQRGIPFTATTIHTVAQAFLAAEYGASFLAPYINRIDDSGARGTDTVRDIAAFLKLHDLPAKILGASFRNVRQITDVLLAGAHTVTIAPDLLWKLAAHPETDSAVAKFRCTWDDEFGTGKNIADL